MLMGPATWHSSSGPGTGPEVYLGGWEPLPTFNYRVLKETGSQQKQPKTPGGRAMSQGDDSGGGMENQTEEGDQEGGAGREGTGGEELGRSVGNESGDC